MNTIFIPHIETILYQLETSPEKYPPNNRSFDWAFNDFAAIPACYQFVVNCGDVPPIVKTCNNLIVSRWPNFNQLSDSNKKAIRERALKLAMDFYRDLHAMALLGGSFGSVVYERGYDLGFNVDFRVTPKPHLFLTCPRIRDAKLGIAAAMQHPRHWRDPESFIAIKKTRRAKRGNQEWPGEIFWLTNQTRPFWRSVNGVWLFGKDHINDLIDDMRAKYSSSGESPEVGISQLPLDL